MSSQKEREKRRERRLAEEAKASGADRRTRILQIGAGAVFLAIVAVVVIIVVAGSSSDSGGDAKNLVEVKEVESLVNDVPQQNLVLGKASAPVELIEYGDLQCPVCKAYSEEVLPPIVESAVKEGKAKVIFRNFLIIGPDSLPAGAAAIAAGSQGKGWDFIELFYRNQGKENGDYVTDEFLEAVAKGSGVKDLAKWNRERKSKKVLEEAERTTEQAQTLGFEGTPSFAIKGPGSNGLELLPEGLQTSDIEEAIKTAS